MTELEILAKLGKKTRERVLLARDAQLERMPLASKGLTKYTGGGFAYGRLSGVWGNKSSGKSSMLLQSLGLAQQQGKVCAFIDAEKSFDKMWATRLGVDTDRLLVVNAGSFMQATDTSVELIQAGIDIVVLDSISALLPQSFFEKDDVELKGLEGTRQIGSNARDLGNMIKLINYMNERTAYIMISQVRNKFLSNGAMHQHMGGFAWDHGMSTTVKIMSSAREQEQKLGFVKDGNILLEVPIAREVLWTVDKNKLGPSFRNGRYDFFYAGDSIGIDNLGEIIDIGLNCGLVSKSGSWLEFNGISAQGKDKLRAKLEQDILMYEKLVKEVEQFESIH